MEMIRKPAIISLKNSFDCTPQDMEESSVQYIIEMASFEQEKNPNIKFDSKHLQHRYRNL